MQFVKRTKIRKCQGFSQTPQSNEYFIYTYRVESLKSLKKFISRFQSFKRLNPLGKLLSSGFPYPLPESDLFNGQRYLAFERLGPEIQLSKLQYWRVTPLRWLDTVFQGQYLPSFSINYVAKNKVLENLPPQLYQIKMKICSDQGCNGIGVVIATK